MKYHTFWRRVAAFLIDALVFLPLNAAVMATIWVRGEIDLSAYIGVALLTIVLHMTYFVMMTAKRGQTLGKMALGVKVLRLDGTPVSCREAAFRYAPFLLVTLVTAVPSCYLVSQMDRIDLIGLMTLPPWMNAVGACWLVALAIVAACNIQRRAIHDFVARTVVIVIKHA